MPYFGKMPEWFHKYEKPKGYDFILDVDLESFKKRVKDKLGIDYPGVYGSGKLHDYRGALGLLYEEEIKGHDFWVTTDFDMVYGDVDKWFTDELLDQYDIISNHDTYVSGPWSMYRNIPLVNELFKKGEWKENMSSPESTGWIESGYSRVVENSGLRWKYMSEQGDPYHPPFNLKKVNGKLYQDGVEIPMLHFRRLKTWPL